MTYFAFATYAGILCQIKDILPATMLANSMLARSFFHQVVLFLSYSRTLLGKRKSSRGKQGSQTNAMPRSCQSGKIERSHHCSECRITDTANIQSMSPTYLLALRGQRRPDLRGKTVVAHSWAGNVQRRVVYIGKVCHKIVCASWQRCPLAGLHNDKGCCQMGLTAILLIHLESIFVAAASSCLWQLYMQ